MDREEAIKAFEEIKRNAETHLGKKYAIGCENYYKNKIELAEIALDALRSNEYQTRSNEGALCADHIGDAADMMANADLLARAEAAEARAEKAERAVAELMGISPKDRITTCFGHPLDRVMDLVEADREGRCVVLPCKVGDTINAFRWSKEKGTTIVSDVVTSVTTNRNGWTVKTKSKFYPIKQKDEYDFAPIAEYPYALADFYVGSRESAEAAPKGEQDG